MKSRINPNTLSKKLQRIYYGGRCRHRHLYSEHPNCFKTEVLEKNGKVKEGYLDIETTGLEADYHHIISWVIKEKDGEYYTGMITKQDLDDETFDKRILEELIEVLDKFDIIYTYNGTRFDNPFMRSRCMYWGIPFPEFGELQHKDLYYLARRLLRTHNKTLDTVTNFLGIKGKNHCMGIEWMCARVGHQWALDYVMKHNKIDCDILEKLHRKLENFAKRTVKSV